MGRQRLQKGRVIDAGNGSHRIEWYEYRRGLDGKEKRCHRSLTLRGSKTEAKLKLQGILADSQITRPDPSITLRSFVLTKWLPLHAGKWRSDSTRKTNDQILKTHVIEPLGNLQLGQIDKPVLQAVLNRLAETLSHSLVQHLHSFLKSIFAEACEQDFLRKSPARSLEMPRCARDDSADLTLTDKPTLTVSQLRDLIGAFAGRDRLIVMFASLMAMRPSEIFCLRWDAFTHDTFFSPTMTYIQTSPESAPVLIEAETTPSDLAIVQRTYRGSISAPKTSASRAQLPVPDLVVEALMRYRQTCPQSAVYMFESATRKPLLKANWLVRVFYPQARKAVQIGFPVNFQTLRRTWCTLSDEYGTDQAIRTAVMRHSRVSLGVTEGTYRRILRPAMIGPMNALADAVLRDLPDEAHLPEIPETLIEGSELNISEQDSSVAASP